MEPLDLRNINKSESEPELHQTSEPFVEEEVKAGFGSYFLEIVKIIFVSLLIIVPIRLWVVQPFIVEGDSMIPNFHDGEYLIVDEISMRFAPLTRGEVVIFHPPSSPKTFYIKRVIGLPNETVEIKDDHINIYNEAFPKGKTLDEQAYLPDSSVSENVKITLKDDEYFVLGDNRNNSLDSRRIGPITISHIKGRAWVRAFPFNQFTIFNNTSDPLELN